MKNLIRFSLFTILLFCLSYALYILPYAMAGKLLFGTPLIAAVLFWPTAFVTMLLFAYMRTHNTSTSLALTAYYGLGIGFTTLWLFTIALGLSALMPVYHFEIGIVATIIAITVIGLALINGRKLTSKSLTIPTKRLSKDISFAFISDVHLGSNNMAHLERIMTQVNKAPYECLIIGGDLFDSSAFSPDQLAPLQKATAPIFFITGNHEYYVRDHANKIASLAGQNITILDNEAVSFGEVNMIGISDNQPMHQQAQKAANLIKDNVFNLLLVHQPGIWGKQPEGTDLMLSGHTHNGQIFPFNFLVKLQFKASYGHYKHGGSQLYVSSGAGTWGPKMRLGSRNEVLHITLKAA